MTGPLSSDGRTSPQHTVVAFLKRHLQSWYVGLLVLLGLVLVVTHLGELERFAHLARSAEPAWVLAALGFQLLTYLCAASVWHQALRHAETKVSLRMVERKAGSLAPELLLSLALVGEKSDIEIGLGKTHGSLLYC